MSGYDNGFGVVIGLGALALGLCALGKLLETIQENRALEQRVQVLENGQSGQGHGLLQLRATQESYITNVVAWLEPVKRDVSDLRERVRVIETFRITTPLPPGHGFSLS